MKDFDWKFYCNAYSDLYDCNFNESQAINHWNTYGKNEGRISYLNLSEYENFDWIKYKISYPDINLYQTKEQAILHWVQYGKKQGRNYFTYIRKFSNSNYQFSIVMAYYNRKKQLIQTLNGFEINYTNKYNFEVIIIDDNSNENNKLNHIIKQFNFSINLIEISTEEKGNRINPCVAYNKGFKAAKGDIIIIQNPECYHVGNILEYTKNNLKEQYYFSYSCFSPNNYELTDELMNSDNKFQLVENNGFIKRNTITSNILNWYNHPIYRPVNYHWCSAIYRNKLNIMGGFNEKFANGYCFDDDEFLLSIKYKLKLKIKTIDSTNCFVIHQHHGISFYNKDNFDNLFKINQSLYLNLKNKYISEAKILYITHKNEFNYGYGQSFRIDRYNSLKNDNRFDVADLIDEYNEYNDYNIYSALITTHDCSRIEINKLDNFYRPINPNNDPPIVNYIKLFNNEIELEEYQLDENIIHWCSHICCGHNLKDYNLDIYKSSNNLLQLKTSEISHKFLILEDMHEYTFRGGIKNLCEYIDRYYNYIIYHYEDSPELQIIKNNCKNIKKYYSLPHHINTDIYKIYSTEKIYDIILFGNTYDKVYPLRSKIKKALLKSNLNYKILETPTWNEINENCLDNLAKQLNMSYISISTGSIFKYAVCKYFEIAACNSVVAGDQPKPIDEIFGDNMIKLDISMSEEDIIQILENALKDKNKLLEISNYMYNKISKEYNLASYNNKLHKIVMDCLPINI